jgi:hypothetical protein
VLTKEFIVDGARAETRLLMRHEDGAWAGYSYKWNEAGTDAVLVPNGSTYNTGSRTWEIPSSAQCMQCHTTVAGQTLGMETAQQNRAHDYGGGGLHNQITTLDHIGLFTAGPGAPANLPALPELGGDAPAKDQARAYLSVNCAHCHVPGGPSQGNLDLHWKTADAAMNVCNEAPQHGNLGVSGAMLVAPGNPAASVLSLRMHTLAAERMPRIGSKRVDTDATAVVDDWITNLQSCP